MMNIRPEARGVWDTWKQVIFGGVVALAGIYIGFTTFGLTRWAGVLIFGMGALIAFDGYRRVRFPWGSNGAGIVEIDERQITYLSATGGNSVSLDNLQRVELHRNARGRKTWVFYDAEGMLAVPTDASGSENLYDALVALPGLNFDQVQAADQGEGTDIFLIWNKTAQKLH